jgi:Ima1 N-terminal domain
MIIDSSDTAEPKPTLTKSPEDDSPFCRDCLSNQVLQLHLLANRDPGSDAEDEAYAASLHERYPLVCPNCAPLVEDKIRRRDYRSKAVALGASLDTPAANMRPSLAPSRIEEALWHARRVAWWITHFATLALLSAGM